jgi:hypothetical protein
MEVFIIYFPHYLRLHEIYSLTGYMHPFRFIAEVYRLDLKQRSTCSVATRVLDENRIGGLLRYMESSIPEVPDNYLLPLPSSIPGTAMKWPDGVATGIRPSKDLFTLGLLDYIRTLGLPMHHHVKSKRNWWRYQKA